MSWMRWNTSWEWLFDEGYKRFDHEKLSSLFFFWLQVLKRHPFNITNFLSCFCLEFNIVINALDQVKSDRLFVHQFCSLKHHFLMTEQTYLTIVSFTLFSTNKSSSIMFEKLTPTSSSTSLTAHTDFCSPLFIFPFGNPQVAFDFHPFTSRTLVLSWLRMIAPHTFILIRISYLDSK